MLFNVRKILSYGMPTQGKIMKSLGPVAHARCRLSELL